MTNNNPGEDEYEGGGRRPEGAASAARGQNPGQ